ncbi:MAG: cyclic pyranopterin monophosphate synthase MoaC [Clostridiales bacterium]
MENKIENKMENKIENRELTHVDENGRAKMVDVSAKSETKRVAVARGWVEMAAETLQLIAKGGMKKGDVLGVAQVAGIMGAKRAPDLIPMCHPLLLTGIEMDFRLDFPANKIHIEAKVGNTGQTGVEIEALTAVAIAGLTIYDMCKAIDRGMVIGDIRLIEKSGGKSGIFIRQGENEDLWQK